MLSLSNPFTRHMLRFQPTAPTMHITPTPEIFEPAPMAVDVPINSPAVQFAYDLEPSSGILGKRRRNGCEEAADLSPRSKFHLKMPSEDHSSMKFLWNPPSPPSEDDVEYDFSRTWQDPPAQTTEPTKHKRRFIPIKKTHSAPTNTQLTPTMEKDITQILTPCHVCYKAPKLKRDLDAYEDCWRCKERTCFICIRVCTAGCDRRKVCGKCCVEQGEDGNVSCLDCLQRPHLSGLQTPHEFQIPQGIQTPQYEEEMMMLD